MSYKKIILPAIFTTFSCYFGNPDKCHLICPQEIIVLWGKFPMPKWETEQGSLNLPSVFLSEKTFYETHCNLALLPYTNNIRKLQRQYTVQSEHPFYGQGLCTLCNVRVFCCSPFSLKVLSEEISAEDMSERSFYSGSQQEKQR